MTEAAKQNRMEILDRWQELITRCGFTVLIDEDGVFVSENTGNGRTARFPDGISALSALHLEVIENILGDLAQKTRECQELQEQMRFHEINRDEREQICAEFNIPPADCCKPKYCALAPYKEVERLKAQVEQLERQVAELSKPVTDADLAEITAIGYWLMDIGSPSSDRLKANIERWIAARAALPKSENPL